MQTPVAVARFGLAVILLAFANLVLAQNEARNGIDASNAKWIQALSRGDAAAIAALYTDNAQLLPANGNVVSGRDGIRKYWQAGIDAGFKTVKFDTLEVEAFGNTAYEVGKWTVPGSGGKADETGDYIVIWKRENGQWKLHRDTWTTNAPAASQ